MAEVKKYLRIWTTDDGHEAIPVGARFKLDDDALLEEWLTVKALDGSTVHLRTSTIRRAQVANAGTF